MIRFSGVRKSFGSNIVLDDLSLEVRKGETMVVIGQSGAGKSVLLKLLIGILLPDAGSISVDGLDVTALPCDERRKITRKFGMLFQGAALFDSLTVGENVAFGLERYSDLGKAEIQRAVAESLARVGLHEVESLLPYELSGGMKKRVGLARAIVYGPEIMLYDEPSTGIDPIRADAINDLIVRLRTEMRVTSIVITHDMVSAYKVADRIALLHQGRIVALGTSAEIRESPNDVVQQFIHGRAEGPIASR
jgi:phospholipid/cholesterol/gamma-HCH transport system ATP-binding protein